MLARGSVARGSVAGGSVARVPWSGFRGAGSGVVLAFSSNLDENFDGQPDLCIQHSNL